MLKIKPSKASKYISHIEIAVIVVVHSLIYLHAASLLSKFLVEHIIVFLKCIFRLLYRIVGGKVLSVFNNFFNVVCAGCKRNNG